MRGVRKYKARTKRTMMRKPKKAWKTKVINAMAPAQDKASCRATRMSLVAATFQDTKTMYSQVINNIEPFNDVADLSSGGMKQSIRLGALVDLRGWRYDIQIKNLSSDPCYLNIAIVQSKSNNATTFGLDGFFRDYGESRDVTFSPLVTAHGMNRYPISPDNNIVLMKRQILVPKGPGNGSLIDEYSYPNINVRRLRGYIPFKRTISFNDDTSFAPDRPIWFIHWVAEPLEATVGPPVVASHLISKEVVAFWKNKI